MRAWSEDGHVRVRLLCAGPIGDPEVRLAATPTDAARQLNDWLDRLCNGAGDDRASRETTDE